MPLFGRRSRRRRRRRRRCRLSKKRTRIVSIFSE
jgi:hypothetical protein